MRLEVVVVAPHERPILPVRFARIVVTRMPDDTFKVAGWAHVADAVVELAGVRVLVRPDLVDGECELGAEVPAAPGTLGDVPQIQGEDRLAGFPAVSPDVAAATTGRVPDAQDLRSVVTLPDEPFALDAVKNDRGFGFGKAGDDGRVGNGH